jgi:hypothetical protein
VPAGVAIGASFHEAPYESDFQPRRKLLPLFKRLPCLSLAWGLSSQEAPNALQRSNCSALGSGWRLATTRGCLGLVRPVCFCGIEGTVGLRGMGLEVN